MMDLRVSVVLLFFFLTGGYSLRCYSCTAGLTGSCKPTGETCPAGSSACFTIIGEKSNVGLFKTKFVTNRGCLKTCEPGTEQVEGVPVTIECCYSDLCNAADGVYKGSFLLLFSPLLFYFLFQ